MDVTLYKKRVIIVGKDMEKSLINIYNAQRIN
jgi:hypothetical protein